MYIFNLSCAFRFWRLKSFPALLGLSRSIHLQWFVSVYVSVSVKNPSLCDLDMDTDHVYVQMKEIKYIYHEYGFLRTRTTHTDHHVQMNDTKYIYHEYVFLRTQTTHTDTHANHVQMNGLLYICCPSKCQRNASIQVRQHCRLPLSYQRVIHVYFTSKRDKYVRSIPKGRGSIFVFYISHGWVTT